MRVLFFYRAVLGQPLGDVNALRAHRPIHERHAPRPSETSALLQTVHNHAGYPTNLIELRHAYHGLPSTRHDPNDSEIDGA